MTFTLEKSMRFLMNSAVIYAGKSMERSSFQKPLYAPELRLSLLFEPDFGTRSFVWTPTPLLSFALRFARFRGRWRGCCFARSAALECTARSAFAWGRTSFGWRWRRRSGRDIACAVVSLSALTAACTTRFFATTGSRTGRRLRA